MTIRNVLPLAMLAVVSMACAPAAEMVPAETGSAAEATPHELTGECNAKTLDYAIGTTLDAALQARLKNEAKAGTVRVAAHDGVITMDFSPSRLNIFVDEKQKIVRIDCG